ncbi:glutaminyl-peptide cyclotransferase [Pedobacter montanisoli]|uniref:Glutaminyl-peptide cyclotransferase n=1 Tax=Pedobacter montanisoli TaxID=2923277 RepID=A0ABS9ZVE9_9SPHI|nr:glutaminyl-peptide cyclotransferase [Pedobacter montanisoli]MCJ0742178.1 glutaminyl-peptide cyclotransferase [Pedobacter montanisoli]
MHFGRINLISSCFFLGLFLVCACNAGTSRYIGFSSPYQGQNIKSGTDIKVKLDLPKNLTADTISYFVDGNLYHETISGADTLTIKTHQMKLGFRLINAIVKLKNMRDTIATNVVITSAIEPKKLSYKVLNKFPHNTDDYTQGLSFDKGYLIESTGRKGSSKLKYVNIQTGKAIKETSLDAQYFGEGSVKIGNEIIVLTWQEDRGLIYDAESLKQKGSFLYGASKEGWGLTFDGKNLLKSDGSNKIWRLNAQNYKEEGYIEVYDNTGPVNELNELEYINGKIYANVYTSTKIIIIDPLTGVVEAYLDLKDLVPKNYFKTEDDRNNNVLNGIAYDPATQTLYVTGKKWPWLYQIKIAN